MNLGRALLFEQIEDILDEHKKALPIKGNPANKTINLETLEALRKRLKKACFL